MNIIVCVKEIPDPEIPAKAFQIDADKKRAVLPGGRKMIISDYDESAAEAALRIKDSTDSNITILSLGQESAQEVIRHCLSMGCDEGILISDPLFDDTDSFATASVLTEAIKKKGQFDLILCGVEEGEWDEGQVGSGIAILLGLPCVTAVTSIEIKDNVATMERMVQDGREIVEVTLPAIATVSSEIGEPRYPSFRKIREAQKKDVTVWGSAEITPPEPLNKMLSLFIPSRGDGQCELVEGESAEEKAVKLAMMLREAKLI